MKPKILVVGRSNTDIIDAVRFANAAGGLSVMRIGAQPSAPTKAAINRFLEQQLS